MKQRGQTLIEVMVALSAAIVIVAAITSAVVSTLSNAQFTTNQSLATQYASQGLEVVRSMRNTSYSTFASLAFPTYCLAQGCTIVNNNQGDPCGQSTGVYYTNQSCPTNINNFFIRSLAFDQSSPECQGIATKVTATVAWEDGKCTSRSNLYCHQVSLSTCMSSYTAIPTSTP